MIKARSNYSVLLGLEPRVGIEPTASSLPWKRSATELPRLGLTQPSVALAKEGGAGSRTRTCEDLAVACFTDRSDCRYAIPAIVTNVYLTKPTRNGAGERN